MPELPDLADLIAVVDSRAGSGSALDRVSVAETLVTELNRLGDRLLGYCIEQARAQGHSWSDIGTHLGVSRQAAQQRYGPRWASLTLADLAQAGAFPRLTARTRTALERAEQHVRRLRHDSLGTEHLLLAILDDEQTLAARALHALGVAAADLRAAVEQRVPAGDTPAPAAIPVGASARRGLDAALSEALELGHNYIGTEHLLLGLLHDTRGPASRALAEQGVGLDAVRSAIKDLISEYLRTRE
ncbi:Clp protease N-terminal domain-containing protein [Goodfellowiella coeruleoviolacea]|uniref:Clp protease N-terminal domain-containing protein n=1 Tax=Goodfellowiella coeruleoviolacea TaxID=334858 RepID=UPI000AB4785A|nr:Clp protease N-terminal domain-containing protein [Goodfellowiella coeruleoviolacea]